MPSTQSTARRATRPATGRPWEVGPAHQWIAVAYQNLTARHRLPKPRGKDRRYRIHFGPDEARSSTLGPSAPVPAEFAPEESHLNDLAGPSPSHPFISHFD